jgi:hypothetical protein
MNCGMGHLKKNEGQTMKVILASCALSLIAASAFATPVSRTVDIKGFVQKFCTMSGTLAADDGGDPVQVSGNAATIQNFVNASGMHEPKTIILAIPDAFCNGTARLRLSVTNGALTNFDVAPQPGYSHTVTYIAKAWWDGAFAELESGGATEALSMGMSNGAQSNDLMIEITTDHGTLPLQGGNYTESITVSLEPMV